jgi:putative peptidoglycan binding protein
MRQPLLVTRYPEFNTPKGEPRMNTPNIVRQSVAVALVSLLAGCASWNGMSHQAKATTEGATGGAIVGAAVGGPVGAAVGAGVGGVVAHNNSDKVPTFNAPTTNTAQNRNAYNTAQGTTSSDYASRSSAAMPPQQSSTPSSANAATGTANSTNATVQNENGNMQGGNAMEDRGTVREAQRALNDKGFSAGAVDGIMGPHTEKALRDFQQAQGLSVTGDLDQQTLSALGVSQ